MTLIQEEVPPPRSDNRPARRVDSRVVESDIIRRGSVYMKNIGLNDIINLLRADNDEVVVDMEQINRVKMMHKQFRDGSKFSFNYNTMLLVASVLAGCGLISNSSATIIASMLVSPIMGPVTGMAYGATIYDWSLCWRALKTEVISLMFCIFVGIVICSCTGPLAIASTWPTDEMYVRGTWQNVLVALPVAFFSGMGVAVSLLDEQTSSLVGVAISASLLPPAVNAGILWIAWAFQESGNLGTKDPLLPPTLGPPVVPLPGTLPPITDSPTAAPSFFSTENVTDIPSFLLTENSTDFPTEMENATQVLGEGDNEAEIRSNTLRTTRTTVTGESATTRTTGDAKGSSGFDSGEDEDDVQYARKDYAVGGLASLVLTIANIILIIVASVMMFRLKERLPIKKSIFWTDLGIARKICRNLAIHADDDWVDNVILMSGEEEQQDQVMVMSGEEEQQKGGARAQTTDLADQ